MHGEPAAFWEGRMQLHLTPQAGKIIGYVRDTVVIVGIIAWAFYVFANPDKVDAFLNWMLKAARHM
jgi:hypothetical protein